MTRPNTVLFAVAGSACALVAAAALLAAHSLGRRRERRDFRSWETELATAGSTT